MNRWLALALTAFGLVLSSCTPRTPPAGDGREPVAAQVGTGMTVTGKGTHAILCMELTGPSHVAAATRLRQDMVASSGMTDWHVVHEASKSILYYGRYTGLDNPRSADARRAGEDRKRIAALRDSGNRQLFRFTMLVSLDEAYPGPPEFDLRNAPATAHWTLQIAAYHGSPARKQAAVETAVEARKSGVDAWYYHGDVVSVVTIGLWPKEAVTVDTAIRPPDRDGESLILTRPLPPDVPREIRTPDGRTIRIYAPRIEFHDATLRARMDQYPHHHDNGEVMVRRFKGSNVTLPERSFVIQIPRDSATAGAVDTPAGPTPPAPPPPVYAPGPGGGLRSINDPR